MKDQMSFFHKEFDASEDLQGDLERATPVEK
jgi:hypothetical protein